MINWLGGHTIFLLGDELAEIADRARAAARSLADRIGDLGGPISADPANCSRCALNPLWAELCRSVALSQ